MHGEAGGRALQTEAGWRALHIGDEAPDFQARSTLGAISLSGYRGRWLLFFSHPGDFTPVCTSEFVAIARAAAEFAALHCALLAVSVDSLYSHLAWVKAIRDEFGVTVDFPIVEDPSMAIGRAWGMLPDGAADAATVRWTYVIDPAGVIRAMGCYPATVGRSVDELLRLVAALQRVDGGEVLVPANWMPGDDVLKLPEHEQNGVLESDDAVWFCRTIADGGAG